VLGKDLDANTLVVAQGHDHQGLMSTSLAAIESSWISGTPPQEGAALTAKTRYRQTDASCGFFQDSPNGFSLQFQEAQWAVTPGQSAVLYDGPICLGGGIISL
jgi:tRNA-specific 2-thiouridylase